MIQLPFPVQPVLLHPVRRTAEWCRHQAALPGAAVPPDGGESGALQYPEVFGNGGERHREWTSQLADRNLALGQSGQNSAPRGVGQGGKGAIETP